jgi:hypothetical protein
VHIDGPLKHLMTSRGQGLGREIFDFCYGALEDITFDFGLWNWKGILFCNF